MKVIYFEILAKKQKCICLMDNSYLLHLKIINSKGSRFYNNFFQPDNCAVGQVTKQIFNTFSD